MSMGNFIPEAPVITPCMTASNSSARTPPSTDDAVEAAAGMAHPTVVPTNFDPEDSSEREE